jgi:hypothetical protein
MHTRCSLDYPNVSNGSNGLCQVYKFNRPHGAILRLTVGFVLLYDRLESIRSMLLWT